MPGRSNLIYQYDGSLDGLLCCVFESYVRREVPLNIQPADAEEISLFEVREIATDPAHAERIYRSIGKKMGKEAEGLVSTAFLYGLDGMEMAIYRFICLGYRYGMKTVRMLGEEAVSDVHHMVQSVWNESHQMKEFLRFSEYGGGLSATIEPKHFVLPLLAEHFCGRFSGEHFLIYDKAHGMALIYQPFEAEIIQVDDLQLPEADGKELEYRRLWKGYYDSIAIKERENPRCRMSFMPKRFWEHMTEMREPAAQGISGSGGELLEKPRS